MGTCPLARLSLISMLKQVRQPSSATQEDRGTLARLSLLSILNHGFVIETDKVGESRQV